MRTHDTPWPPDHEANALTRRLFLLCMAAVPMSVALVRTAGAIGIGRSYRVSIRLAIDDGMPAGEFSLRLVGPPAAGAYDVRWAGWGIRSTLVADASGPMLKLAWGSGADRCVEIVQTTTTPDMPAEPVADAGFDWDYSAVELV